MKCRHQRYLAGGNVISGPSSRLALPITPVEDATIIPTGIFVITVPSPTRRLIGVAILPAAGRTRGRNVVVGGSIPGPARALVDVAILPAGGRTRGWNVIANGPIPGPARALVGVAVLPESPRGCRRNLVVGGPVAAPARCWVDIALLPAGRTTDSRHATSGALVISRVPRGRASVLARGLGTFLYLARRRARSPPVRDLLPAERAARAPPARRCLHQRLAVRED
jgi:hypothetical protein